MNVAQLSEKITQEHLHHAYVIEAGREDGVAAIKELLLQFAITAKGNPDFHEYFFDALLLNDANKLRHEQSFYGADGAKKIFIVALNTIGHEAQNALLKTLEEPTEGTHFFFITRTKEVFLPTILSRVQVISPVSSIEYPVSSINAGEKFLAATISERMAMIGGWTKVKVEEKPKAKEEVHVFLESLERALYAALKEGRGDIVRSLEHVLSATHALSGRSPSLKLILEHLALTIPRLGAKS